MRDKDLNFIVANLFDNESASQGDEIEAETCPTANESTYAKRKRREEETAAQNRLSEKKQQVALFKELMGSPSS